MMGRASQSKPTGMGCIGVSRQHYIRVGKAATGKLRSEPDWGNPAVRDRRGAYGNVAMGAGLRPSAKVLDMPPDPTAYAPFFYLDRHKSSYTRGNPKNSNEAERQ